MDTYTLFALSCGCLVLYVAGRALYSIWKG